MMWTMRLLVMVVVLRRLAQKLRKGLDVRRPLATGKPRLNLLEQPAIAVGIRKRRKREIRTTFRIATGSARIRNRRVEWTSSEMKHLADFDATREQVVASRIDVVHGKDQIV